MKPTTKAVRVADPDETASDVWSEVGALQAGARELFKKALRAHKNVCEAAAEEDAHQRNLDRKSAQDKLDSVLWEAEALLNIATDMIAEHYSKGDEPAEKEARHG